MTKSEIGHIRTEIANLNQNLTTQMKSLIDTVSGQLATFSAQINMLNTTTEVRMDKFENRFLFRMFFAVFVVSGLRIC